MNTLLTRLVAKTLLGLLLCCGVSVSFAQQLAVTLDVVQPSCSTYTDGRILANVSGGQAPYAFAWSDGSTSSGLYGLSGGGYSLTVTDATGATARATATVAAPAALAIAAAGQGNVCVNLAGNYLLSATGGTAPYRYQLNGVTTGPQVLGLTPGYYNAVVTDAKGCTANVGIQQAVPLMVTVRTENVVCNGSCDGTVEAQVSGGTGPYTFRWNTGSTDQLVYGLDPGTYTVVVTDANGCTATGSGSLTEPSAIVFNVNVETPCSNGSFASVTASGGVGVLTIRWSTGTIGPRAYLEEGQHYVYIRDENGCETSRPIIVSTGIQAIVTMNVDATCDSLGRSLLCITGGRGPFTYRWSDGQTGIEAVNLAPGVYFYTAIDGAGCRFDGSTEIYGPTPASCLNCTAGAGSLSGGNTTAQACGSNIVLNAAIAGAATVPAGYTTLYLLTTGAQRTILQTSATPSFTVQQAGQYTIHTLVYDPRTLDLSQVQLGVTQAASVFLLIQQGGGSICASLDLTGTTFTVPPCNACLANPGTLTGGNTTAEACGQVIRLVATTGTPPVVPAGYATIYLLFDGTNVVRQNSLTPSFSVTAPGAYQIHTLVYDPNTFNLSSLSLGQTTVASLAGLFQFGGGSLCGGIDPTGTRFVVPDCSNPAGCVGGSPAALRGNEVCFDGTSGTLAATVVRPASVPAGYVQTYLLVKLPSGVIVALSSTPGFTVRDTGRYEIRSLVYHPDSLNLSAAINLGSTGVAAFVSALPECQTLAGADGGAGFDVSRFNPTMPSAFAGTPCVGQQVQLNPGADASLSYVWSPSAGLSNPNSPSPTVTVTSNTTYSVQISRSINGVTCSATKTYTVTVAPLPTIAALQNVATCSPEAVTLSATTETANTVVWSDQASFSLVLSNTNNLQVTTGAPKTYYVRSTSAAGCVTETSLLVGSYPIGISAEEDMTICAGAQATFGITTTTGVPTGYNLVNAQGQTVATSADGNFAVTPQASGSYKIIAQNAVGCTDTADIAIQVSDVSTALFAGTAAMDTTIYPGNDIDLRAVSNGGRSFVFDPGASYLSRSDSSAVVMPTETTTYSVSTTDENGCVATASLVITVLEFVCDRPYLFVPNVFTPDADGINDIFFVDGVNVDQTYYAIFNRWGQLVFEGTEIGNENGYGWDGTFNNMPVDPDVYGLFVRIRCNDGEEFYTQGNVTVIR